MDENTFEGFRSYLLFILSVFRWKASDCICYSFWAFSDERKHFWSIRILFDIDFKRFRMNENNFEAFAFDLPSNLSFFERSKTNLKPCILFAIDFRRFWMDENTFEAFRLYLLFILSVFRWKASDCICYSFWAFSDERKHFWSIRILLNIDFKPFWRDENNFEVFRWDFPLIYSVFWWAKTFLKPLHTICYRFYAFSDGRKNFWRLQIVFAISFSVFGWKKTFLNYSHFIWYWF